MAQWTPVSQFSPPKSRGGHSETKNEQTATVPSIKQSTVTMNRHAIRCLPIVLKAIVKCCSMAIARRACLHHNNAPARRLPITVDSMARKRIKLVGHRVYSVELALSSELLNVHPLQCGLADKSNGLSPLNFAQTLTEYLEKGYLPKIIRV